VHSTTRPQHAAPAPHHNSENGGAALTAVRPQDAAASDRAERRRDPLGRQLLGHLAALRTATLRLAEASPDAAEREELTAASRALAAREAQIAEELAPDDTPANAPAAGRPASPLPANRQLLHARAADLAARVLMVAAARRDTATAVLACARLDAHRASALG